MIILGTKYYRIDEDGNLDLVRVTKLDNDNSGRISCEKLGSKENNVIINKTDLLEKYTELSPDGLVMFNIVGLKTQKDVIVMLYRKKELDNKSTVPYSVCRQSITDFFSNALSKDVQYAGINVTLDSLPEGVNMESLLACDESLFNTIVSIYMDDTLSDILRFVKKKRYNDVLDDLFNEYVDSMFETKDIGSRFHRTMLDKTIIHGHCRELKDLLEINNFEYDMLMGFNINPLNINLEDDCKDGKLSSANKDIIERIVNKNITESLVIEFDKTINLDEIKKDYVLVSDKNKKVYLIAYRYAGKYHIPVEEIESDENIKNIAKSIGYAETSSINEAYLNIIRYNQDKYK